MLRIVVVAKIRPLPWRRTLRNNAAASGGARPDVTISNYYDHYRALSSSSSSSSSSSKPPLPRYGSWWTLPESEREAWQVLGWDADQWENKARRSTPPASAFKPWSKLSASEQAAATHGLGYTAKEWDQNILMGDGSDDDIQLKDMRMTVTNNDENKLERGSSSSPHKSVPVDASVFTTNNNNAAASSSKSNKQESLLSRLSRAAWTVAQVVAPNSVKTLTDSQSPPVVVDGVETTVYLDDSPSMNEWMTTAGDNDRFSFTTTTTTRLEQGKKVLRSLAPALGSLPCRVLKFSNKPTVLSLRQETSAPASSGSSNAVTTYLPEIASGWDGSGHGTYLWHMIQTDVMERYRPGTGRLRLVVVTDGEDNLSPTAEYQGMRGMDPMMKTLQQAGYDIEWHIIVIGCGESGLERRYKALAGATGGSFLAIDKELFDERSREATALLNAIENSTDEYGRRERQRRYEHDANAGKVDKVDWYKKLPPPPDNKK